jgi:uncharacterized protein YbbK (DUF523 family)
LIGSNCGSVDDPPIHRKRLRWFSPNEESGRLHHLRCSNQSTAVCPSHAAGLRFIPRNPLEMPK